MEDKNTSFVWTDNEYITGLDASGTTGGTEERLSALHEKKVADTGQEKSIKATAAEIRGAPDAGAVSDHDNEPDPENVVTKNDIIRLARKLGLNLVEDTADTGSQAKAGQPSERNVSASMPVPERKNMPANEESEPNAAGDPEPGRDDPLLEEENEYLVIPVQKEPRHQAVHSVTQTDSGEEILDDDEDEDDEMTDDDEILDDDDDYDYGLPDEISKYEYVGDDDDEDEEEDENDGGEEEESDNAVPDSRHFPAETKKEPSEPSSGKDFLDGRDNSEAAEPVAVVMKNMGVRFEGVKYPEKTAYQDRAPYSGLESPRRIPERASGDRFPGTGALLGEQVSIGDTGQDSDGEPEPTRPMISHRPMIRSPELRTVNPRDTKRKCGKSKVNISMITTAFGCLLIVFIAGTILCIKMGVFDNKTGGNDFEDYSYAELYDYYQAENYDSVGNDREPYEQQTEPKQSENSGSEPSEEAIPVKEGEDFGPITLYGLEGIIPKSFIGASKEETELKNYPLYQFRSENTGKTAEEYAFSRMNDIISVLKKRSDNKKVLANKSYYDDATGEYKEVWKEQNLYSSPAEYYPELLVRVKGEEIIVSVYSWIGDDGCYYDSVIVYPKGLSAEEENSSGASPDFDTAG